MKSKTNKVKIYCSKGKPVEVTEHYIKNIKKQIMQTIKAKRIENPKLAEFYFYGIAEFSYIKETNKRILLITYGDALSSLSVDKKGKVYLEVPIRVRLSQKKLVIL